MANLIDVALPPMDDSPAETVVAQWLKEVGETVDINEPLLEVNTDKVVLEIPSPAAGVLREVLKRAGDAVSAGDSLGRIEAGSSKSVVAESPSSVEGTTMVRADQARLSPAVRRLLKRHNLDPAQIKGTGRGGRITHGDALDAVRSAPSPSEALKETLPAASAGGSHLTPHTPMRRNIAAHMVESVRSAPHVTSVFEADFSAPVRDRSKRRREFEEKGIPLTYTAYLVAAAARALQAVPEVNSRWREDSLELFDDCNIGVAVALGKGGLVVPVIRKAQDLSLFGIASRLKELSETARANRIKSEHLEGGTFTITNHGTSGSLIATPIIHQPQSAILGVGRVQKRLVVFGADGEETFAVRPMAYVTLTIDHRALDGFTANLFLSRFVEALESWK